MISDTLLRRSLSKMGKRFILSMRVNSLLNFTKVKIMDNDYRDIYFFLIVGIVSFAIILATGIYIETL